MKSSQISFLILVCACWSTAIVGSRKASADSIWLSNSETPVYGIVESQSEQSVTFLQTSDGSTFETVVLDRTQIETLVVSHDIQRLESLRPIRLNEYFEYAEELFPQKQDPVARNLAIRLFVIVVSASNDSEVRLSALNHLVLLARNREEQIRLETLRYFETGDEPEPDMESNSIQGPSEKLRIAAAELVKAVRQRRPISNEIKDGRLKSTVEFYKSVCSWDELILISKSNRINNRQLRRLVALERRLIANPDEPSSSQIDDDSWSTLAKRVVANSKLTVPRIETVTEFDPSKRFYAKGRWVTDSDRIATPESNIE